MSFPNPPSVNTPIPNQPFSYPEVPATFDRLFGSLVPNIQLDPNPSTLGGNGWVRPADWLPMPEVSPTEEKFVGLFAVYDTPENFIAVYFEGDYTVDWGDGTIENFNSGDKAQHSYQWSEIPDSTLTSQGYRQVLVIVTPQSGQNLTIMDLSDRHDNIVTNSDTNTPWLDLVVSMPSADSGGSLRFCGYEYGNNSNGYLFDVQRIVIVNSGLMDDFTECFFYSTSLRKVEILCSLPVNTSFYYLFDACYALTDVVLSDTANVTNMGSMFGGCTALTSVPLFNTANVTDMSYMLGSCNALTSVPLFNTANVTNMSYMLGSCNALTSVPLFNTANVTSMYYMLGGCTALTSVPLFNTANVTNMSYMFSGCPNLQTGALSNTKVNISYQNCLLNRQAIVDIFNGLATASATIDVQGNYGAAELTSEDLAIAIDKGWTVLS